MTLQIRFIEEYHSVYDRSVAEPEAFWAEQASTFSGKPWTSVLKWNFRKPDIKWFVGAKLNITENCLDRHLGNTGKTNCFDMGAQRP